MDTQSFLTIGCRFYPGMIIPLWHNLEEKFQDQPGVRERFRMVLVERGAGILRLGKSRLALTAPVLLCLNEGEIPELEQQDQFSARAIYFHPSVINNKFNFENIRHPDPEILMTETHDLFWLRPFLLRDSSRSLSIPLGPSEANRIAGLMESVRKGLEGQPDVYWPCRTRSYFLELLFLTQRLFDDPESVVWPELPQAEDLQSMAPTILYLHTHYQDRITVEQLCRLFHTNRTTLARQFHAATGFSVMAYLIRLRVHLASMMLRNTTLPVSEVMVRVGFLDNTHFSRTFRRYAGQSPREYRQRFCWMVQ